MPPVRLASLVWTSPGCCSYLTAQEEPAVVALTRLQPLSPDPQRSARLWIGSAAPPDAPMSSTIGQRQARRRENRFSKSGQLALASSEGGVKATRGGTGARAESARPDQFQLKADTFNSPPSVTAAAEISLNLQLQQPELRTLTERFHDADARKRFPLIWSTHW